MEVRRHRRRYQSSPPPPPVSGVATGAVLAAQAGDAAASVWGDAMISKRPAGSSYHIAVVTDDAIQGVTHVVRGKDIEPATSLHRLLQRALHLPSPVYFHHDLIRGSDGQKLSKSLGSTSLRQLRSEGVTAEDIRKKFGFT